MMEYQSSTKGNAKGRTHSYRIRQIIYICGLLLFVICFVVVSQWKDNASQTTQHGLKGAAKSNSEKTNAPHDLRENVEFEPMLMETYAGKEFPDDKDFPDDKEFPDDKDFQDAPDDDLEKEVSPRDTTNSHMIYGTKKKGGLTAKYVHQAMSAGFRHFDTANQPKYYNEAGLGEGWTKAAQELGLKREDIWLQTKFTRLEDQDPDNIPYDKDATLEEQVRQSFSKSLENLKTSYVDSLIIHKEEDTFEKIFTIWNVFQTFVEEGLVRKIGLSNFYDLTEIKYLYDSSKIKPAVIQNRFYPGSDFDVEIREFCDEKKIEYQAFWILSANNQILEDNDVIHLAREWDLTPELVIYAFVLEHGLTPLVGPTHEHHMKQDIDLVKRITSGKKYFTAMFSIMAVKIALGMDDDVED